MTTIEPLSSDMELLVCNCTFPLADDVLVPETTATDPPFKAPLPPTRPRSPDNPPLAAPVCI